MEKYAGILSILNLVLLIAATACLYFGSILTNIYLLPYLDTVNPHFATVPYIMLAIGGLLLLLSLYGFVAAGLQSRPLLLIYAVTAGVVVLLQLASVYVSWELRNELNNRLMFKQSKIELTDEMRLYWEDEDVKYKWDTLQREYQCCGANTWDRGFHDWSWSRNGEDTPGVPDSCCLEEKENCGQRGNIFEENHPEWKIYIHGCMEVLNQKLHRDIVPDLEVYVGSCALLCLVTIICLVLASANVASISRKEGRDDGLGMYQQPYPGNRYEEMDVHGLKTLDSGLGGGGSLRSVQSHTSRTSDSVRTPIIKQGAPQAHRASLYIEPTSESATVI